MDTTMIRIRVQPESPVILFVVLYSSIAMLVAVGIAAVLEVNETQWRMVNSDPIWIVAFVVSIAWPLVVVYVGCSLVGILGDDD